MFSKEKPVSEEKRKFLNALVVPFVLVVAIFLTFILEKGMGWDFHSAGVFPRNARSLTGIFTLIFIHADWGHLLNNLLSLFLLSTALFYFYSQISVRILIYSVFFSGLLLWFIGRPNWHIGASGLIYALAAFLFFSGLLRSHIPLIAISLVVTFVYGSMVWHVFPWSVNDPVSWEGHLAGAFTGIVLAVVFRGKGPQKPEPEWNEENDDSFFMEDFEENSIENNVEKNNNK